MKFRPLLMTLALLPLLAACGQTNAPGATAPATDSAPAAAPAAETPAAPATDTAAPAAADAPAAPAEGATPANAETQAPAPAPAPTAPSGPAPVAGVDYDLIPNGQPYAPLNGKIEVVEVFGYVCPA